MSNDLTHEQRIAFLMAIPGETISPKQASNVLDGSPYWYNLAARAGILTLPHMWRGRNLRIFRQPIINLLTNASSPMWQAAPTAGEGH